VWPRPTGTTGTPAQDPAEQLAALVERFRAVGTVPQVLQVKAAPAGGGAGKWVKRQLRPIDVAHQLQKVTLPGGEASLTARLAWHVAEAVTLPVDTREEAQGAGWPSNLQLRPLVAPNGKLADYWARLAFQGGAWAVVEVGSDLDAVEVNMHFRYSGEGADKGGLRQWWLALGGK
jgi:hypothetical protein